MGDPSGAGSAGGSPAATKTSNSDQLYGPRANVCLRWPELQTKGEIWEQIDKCYAKKVEQRPWFLPDGSPAIKGSPLNPRNLKSAQKKYMKRIISEGYDPEGRGIPQGYESDVDPTETLLLGGKQLAMAFYRAWELAPTNPNVLRAKELGYKVMMRPREMPRDVMEEIVKHSNRNNKGVQDTLPERVLAVPGVLSNFRADLASRQIDPSTLPTKGEYTYHKLLATFISERYEDAVFTSIFGEAFYPESVPGPKSRAASFFFLPTLLG